MAFKMTDLKKHIPPFLEYRKSMGYTGGATANSKAIDLKLFIHFMDTNNRNSISGANKRPRSNRLNRKTCPAFRFRWMLLLD